MTQFQDTTPRLSKFSFNEPSTFHLGNAKQRQYLVETLEREFSLTHLPESHRQLIEEALRHSGVEVHNACEIERKSDTNIRAFFRRWSPQEHHLYHPELGLKNLNKTEEDSSDLDWQPHYDDLTEFAYPFAEPQVVPKAVPVNLSSVHVVQESEDSIELTAEPSRLLVAKIPNDNIVDIQDLVIDFKVNQHTRRVTEMQLRLREPIRVYRGIKLNELTLNFEFGDDLVSGRNVLLHTNQTMRGRLWATFRPRLQIHSQLTYNQCHADIPTQSYLFESMASIENLLSKSTD